jgi:hypothetical protein
MNARSTLRSCRGRRLGGKSPTPPCSTFIIHSVNSGRPWHVMGNRHLQRSISHVFNICVHGNWLVCSAELAAMSATCSCRQDYSAQRL